MADDLKNGIAKMHDNLVELEAEARKLKNQNFADIVASAKNRLQQLMGHPDLERVGSGDGQTEKPPFDPTAGQSPAPASNASSQSPAPTSDASGWPQVGQQG